MISNYNYKIENFVATPADGEQYIKIYNKFGKLVHDIAPTLAYFYQRNHYIIIEIHGDNTIILDFENENTAMLAITKLNDIKNTIYQNTQYSFTNLELLNGALDVRYYPNTVIDSMFYTRDYLNVYFSRTGHTHTFSNITDSASTSIVLQGSSVPSSSGDTGIPGTLHSDGNYLYYCYATDS